MAGKTQSKKHTIDPKKKKKKTEQAVGLAKVLKQYPKT